MSDLVLADTGYGTASARDYLALLKPRVMTLVVFTGYVGLHIAPGDLPLLTTVVAVLCIAIGAGAAGAINMWYDRDIDAIMQRTRRRPVPAGRVAPGRALAFGATLGMAAVAVMALTVNPVAAALLAVAQLFYVFVYTIWLKRRTPQNIVIGGAAGAFPPMIGWAAATGSVDMTALALFAIIFFWTPPHFWALALYRSDDYRRAGVPMLPVTHGARTTKRQMLYYSLLLLPLSAAPALTGAAGLLYGILAPGMSLLFLAGTWRVWREDGVATGHQAARHLFGFSILYLFMIFILLVLDSGVQP